MQIFIGTSGYDHPELKGSFYPPDLPRKDFLAYYSAKFNALELNSTFYGMPTAERMHSFYERSEGRLKFSVKINRQLTHEISRQWQNHAEEFTQAMSPLLKKKCTSFYINSISRKLSLHGAKPFLSCGFAKKNGTASLRCRISSQGMDKGIRVCGITVQGRRNCILRYAAIKKLAGWLCCMHAVHWQKCLYSSAWQKPERVVCRERTWRKNSSL